MRRLSKLVALSARHRHELVRAQLALLRAQLAVWMRPRGHLVQLDAGSTAHPDDAAVRTATRVASAVSVVARGGVFRPSCLVRSVALASLLDRNGIPGWRIRIGVRGSARTFEAHAWVELGDVVLGDSPDHTDSFERLADVRLVEAG
ncbi:MAG: lasso peptide biosynthesis B2 protein [Gemmatimonadaceae bacterium]